jgi:hypothetical protein
MGAQPRQGFHRDLLAVVSGRSFEQQLGEVEVAVVHRAQRPMMEHGSTLEARNAGEEIPEAHGVKNLGERPEIAAGVEHGLRGASAPQLLCQPRRPEPVVNDTLATR